MAELEKIKLFEVTLGGTMMLQASSERDAVNKAREHYEGNIQELWASVKAFDAYVEPEQLLQVNVL